MNINVLEIIYLLRGVCLFYSVDKIPIEYQYYDNPKLGGYPAMNGCPVVANTFSSNYWRSFHCRYGGNAPNSDLLYGEKLSPTSLCFISFLFNSTMTGETTWEKNVIPLNVIQIKKLMMSV